MEFCDVPRIFGGNGKRPAPGLARSSCSRDGHECPGERIIAANEHLAAGGKKVWIIENSGVASAVLDEVPDAPVICTHGQFRTAAWIMLQRLAENGCTFYYSSDLDPEGVAMAERLSNRFPGQTVFWRMDPDAYLRVLSEEDISARLSKLDAVQSPELLLVANEMRLKKKRGTRKALPICL